jgi:cytochrome c oxidase cbb3-type subunit 3
MPSFRGRIPDDQIWEIAAYVRALGGFVAKDVATGRNDDLHPRPAENRLPRQDAVPAPAGAPPE